MKTDGRLSPRTGPTDFSNEPVSPIRMRHVRQSVIRQLIMQIPTQVECFQIIDDHGMLSHIVDHSRQVCRVAMRLVDGFNAAGVNVHRQLVQAAALLHDITKTRSFETGENHAETGGALLSALGYPEVADIIRQHVKLDTYDVSEVPHEPEIVNYADKRVLHDRIVTLTERMDYILEKYGTSPERRERILWLAEKSRDLEKRICQVGRFSPADIGAPT